MAALPTENISTQDIRSVLNVTGESSFGGLCNNADVNPEGLDAFYCSGETPVARLAELRTAPFQIAKFRNYDHTFTNNVIVEFNSDGSINFNNIGDRTVNVTLELYSLAGSFRDIDYGVGYPSSASTELKINGSSFNSADSAVAAPDPGDTLQDEASTWVNITGYTSASTNSIFIEGDCLWDEATMYDERYSSGKVILFDTSITSGTGGSVIGEKNMLTWTKDQPNCEFDISIGTYKFLNVSVDQYNFTKNGGSIEVIVNANYMNAWTSSDSCTWITANSSGTGKGSFTIYCDEQSDESPARSGKITISSSDVSALYINITQDASMIVIGSLELDFMGTTLPIVGDSIYVEPSGGGSWTISGTVESGIKDTLDWSSAWGVSGETEIKILTYGSQNLEGYLTLAAGQVTALNNGNLVIREPEMSISPI